MSHTMSLFKRSLGISIASSAILVCAAAPACAEVVAPPLKGLNASAPAGNQLTPKSAPKPTTASAPKHMRNRAANSSDASQSDNTLASGTVTKGSTQRSWQVTDNSTNAKDANTTLMREYGKRLSYDFDNRKLVASVSDTQVTGEASNVMARKYNHITLQTTNSNETVPTTIIDITETPWIYKDQHSKNLWDEINNNKIGSYSWTKFGLSQVIGGEGLNGLSYNFTSHQVEGTPTVTDWKAGETSRNIPVYMATTHKGADSDYITWSKLKEFTVNKPAQPNPPVAPPIPKPKPPVTPTPQPQPKPVANELASGTVTDKNGKQIQWKVINNDAKPDTEQMKRYAQYLSYNPDTNALTTTVNAAPFTGNDANIAARKFSNITLIVKNGNGTEFTTVKSITETPWFFKDQNSQKTWDSINKTKIGTYTFAKYNLEQRVGGEGLEGLSYDFLNKNFDGTPTITWESDEKIRIIPVYIAAIHKSKDGSDYMTVGELKKFKAYKNRNDIFEGTAGTNPRTKRQYQFSDLGCDNVKQTVRGMYANGPIYLKAGETKTVPLKFYLVNDDYSLGDEVTDEFMKVLAPEPHESLITKVLLTRNLQTSLTDMNVSYVLHTDYSITFTANKDAQVGDSYNTDGSKLDNLPSTLSLLETPNYTYEPGITLHKKGHPEQITLINAFFDVIAGTPDPVPQPQPQPQPPTPAPTPQPPAPEPAPQPQPQPQPVPVPAPTPEPPAPVPAPQPAPTPEPPAPQPAPAQEPQPVPKKQHLRRLPQTGDDQNQTALLELAELLGVCAFCASYGIKRLLS